MKRTIITAVAVAGSIALAGCGSSGTATSGSGAPSSGASSSSSSSTSAAPTAGQTVDLAPIMKKSSEAVLAKKTAHLSIATSAGSIVADVRYGGASAAMHMTMDAAGQKMETIFVDKVLYLGGPMAASLGGGKKWVKIDPNGTDPLSKQLAPVLNQMSTAAQDPTKALAALSDVKAKVAAVAGGNTSYAVTLDKAQVDKMLKASGSGALGAQASAAIPHSIAYTITLDGDSLPVKIVTNTAGVDSTVTFSKWGQPVTIAAPPASEVGTAKMPG